MNNVDSSAAGAWNDTCRVAALFAVDPAGLGGINLRALAGAVRDHFLQLLRESLPAATPWRRLPLGVSDGRLLGGLDLAATLKTGRPVAERGILLEADGGIILLAMAERLSLETAARLNSVLDSGELMLERDGFTLRSQVRVGMIALDEGMNADENPPAALLDRFAFQLDLNAMSVRELTPALYSADQIAAARLRLARVRVSDEAIEALCAVAQSVAIDSLRAPLLAVKAACAAAALAEREYLVDDDVALAARLVFAHRATALPDSEQQAPESENNQNEEDSDTEQPASAENDIPLEDIVREAVNAALPDNLLEQLKLNDIKRSGATSSGRVGVMRKALLRGRPTGIRKGDPGNGNRLNVVETLRAAAPWQRLRRRHDSQRIEVRREDFRIMRFQQRSQTTTIFVVDASGSSALQRLAEAKGAVELLLADCYVRRDQVALLAFRGKDAELLLPPTRSLVRAKRSLAALPGGGGTPLATAIDAAVMLADAVQRRGDTPVVVLLTDGRANIARDGSAGRAQANEDALQAAARLRNAAYTTLLIDISARPQMQAKRLAEAMLAHYLPLPYADAAALSQTIQTVTATQ